MLRARVVVAVSFSFAVACGRPAQAPDDASFTVDPSLLPPPDPSEPTPRWPVAPPSSPELLRAARPRDGRYHAPPFVPAAPSPWIGPTSMVVMEWQSGCTGHVVRRTVAIELDGVRYPLAHVTSTVRLFDPSEIPNAPCSRVSGHPIELGHEGIVGSPVFALAVDGLEEVRCR